MGLDMSLYRRVSKNPDDDQEVAYWRKANAIHRYFTNDAEDDNCVDFEVTLEDIQTLIDICLASIEDKVPLLPTGEGFFWGSTDYDKWYYGYLQDTVDYLQDILITHEVGHSYYYKAWY